MAERPTWISNSKSLVYAIYFCDGKLFGIRAEEHRNLRVNNFRIDSVSVTYDESTSKTFHGGLKDLNTVLELQSIFEVQGKMLTTSLAL